MGLLAATCQGPGCATVGRCRPATLFGTVRSRLRFSPPTPAFADIREKRDSKGGEPSHRVGTPPRIQRHYLIERNVLISSSELDAWLMSRQSQIITLLQFINFCMLLGAQPDK